MAVFVELEDDDVEPPQHIGSGDLPIWKLHNLDITGGHREQPAPPPKDAREEAHEFAVRELHNRNPLTEALGCYPIISAVTANIDLNTLDNLSQTCRQVRADLLQYRKPLLATALRCCNEDLPVDGEETLRYRARAGNWFYMEETGRSTNYNGKSGKCARDMVSECRRCGTVVCRNCAIKPPMPVVLRDRHRRLCRPCVKAPIGELLKPRLSPDVSIDSDDVQRAVCKCATSGVWLCQPCGRSIRSADFDYQAIWKWRNQYGDPHGNVGIGIGEGDRGVICGREGSCCAAKEREQEIDCDAEDARGEGFVLGSSPATHSTVAPPWSSEDSLPTAFNASWAFMPPTDAGDRTPSPALGPGYARHEVEGIGGVIKKTMVKMVKIGACVPEYREERQNSALLQREIQGRVRSWCGWCWRVIPSRKDLDHEDCAASSGSSSSSE